MWARAVSVVLIGATTLASGAVVDIEPRDAFTSCLTSSGSGGTIVTPSSSTYASSRAAFNKRLSYQPAAIAYPSVIGRWSFNYSLLTENCRKSPGDVQKYVKCAATSKIPVVGRSGGHSYAAYGVSFHPLSDAQMSVVLTSVC